MLEPPTGWQFVLERPGQRAVITEVGAALRSWRAAGAERLDGFPVGSPGDGQCGKVRAPDAHDGLLLWVNWRPVRRGADRVALAYVLHPQPGYPHTVGVEVEYALAPEGGLPARGGGGGGARGARGGGGGGAAGAHRGGGAAPVGGGLPPRGAGAGGGGAGAGGGGGPPPAGRRRRAVGGSGVRPPAG